MSKKILLVIAGLLLVVGILKPDLSSWLSRPNNVVDTIVVITPPSDPKILELCDKVTKSFGSSPTRVGDAKRLSSLYMDIANLIDLDGDNEVVKNTNEVRQVNSISGLLLQLDIKGKYPDLAKDAQAVVISSVGDDDVLLSPELRTKASEGFRALSWACNEATK
jgi:hypothetical protein